MLTVSDEHFQCLIDKAMATLPQEHIRHLENVAIVYANAPSYKQRLTLKLRDDQTLFGLYEGVPLSQRQGMTRLIPDKITIFKGPISASVNTDLELEEQVRHTLWHEIAHYYGLNHAQIYALE